MRVPTYTLTSDILQRLESLSTKRNLLHKQAATGRRLERPSDDPALMNRTLHNLSEQRDMQQYRRNQNYADAISMKSYSVLQRFQDMTNRAQEISMLGGAVLNDDHFIAYAEEVNEMINEAVGLGNSTHLGRSIFAGTNTGVQPFNATVVGGEVTALTYDGNTDDAQVFIGKNAKITPNLESSQNAQLIAFTERLITLRDELRAGNDAAVSALQFDFLDSEDDMVRAIGNVAATQARIQTAQVMDERQYSKISETIAAETEVDLPTAITQLSQTQVAYEAALQGGAKIMNMSLLNYLR